MPTPSFPPGPVSGALGLKQLGPLRHDLVGFTRGLASHYGDCVYYRCGPIGQYHFFHPQQIQEVLIARAKSFQKPFRLKRALGRIEGKGLILSEGELWARQHRLVQIGFQPKRFRDYGVKVGEVLARELPQWDATAEINIAKINAHLTLQVVAKTLFDADLGKATRKMGRAVDIIQRYVIKEMGALIPVPGFVPTPRNMMRWWAKGFLNRLVRRVVKERRQSKRDRGDLLSTLIDAVDNEGDGKGMSDLQLRNEMITLLLAGHDTTATALTWAAYLLAVHPEQQSVLAHEVRRALGDRTAGYDDLAKLKGVESTLKEAMRLYPPVYFFSREATEEVEIAGFRIKKGSQVHLCPLVTHRDPRWHSEPDKFLPFRFLANYEERLPPFAYFPFGGGARVCIGKSFALMESVLILSGLLQRYEWKLAPGQGEPEWATQITLYPKGGVRLSLQKRA